MPSDRSFGDRRCRISKDKKCRSSYFWNGISLNLLTHGSQPYFSNILPARHSESNPHSLAGHYRRDSLTPTSAPWSHPVHPRPRCSQWNFSPIPEQQLHAVGVHVEFASSFIVLHVCVLSALRHLYSCDLCDMVFFLIRFWTHSRREGAFILLSEESKPPAEPVA